VLCGLIEVEGVQVPFIIQGMRISSSILLCWQKKNSRQIPGPFLAYIKDMYKDCIKMVP